MFGLDRWRLARAQRGQGLVEYGLIVAVVAFVGVAGLNVLSGAQKAYFTDLPLAAAPPNAPGALLHPTSVDPPVCTPASPTPAGTPIQCTTTVHDTFSNPADRNPPWGTIQWSLDGNPIGACTLPTISSGAQNTCAAPMTYTPLGWWMVGNHILIASYAQAVAPAPGSNHVVSPSPPLALQFIENLQFTTSCKNEVISAPAGQAEIGHPLNCSVTLIDSSGGTPVPAAGWDVTWSVTNGAWGGVGMFTCASPLDIWNDHVHCPRPMINPGGTDTLVCTTDASGKCAVIYRHLYDSWAHGAPSSATLRVSASSSASTYPVTITAPGIPHASGVVALCTSLDANATVQSDPVNAPSVSFPVGGVAGSASLALFRGTHNVDVVGAVLAQLTCTATVADADPNPAAVTTNSNLGDAHPPLGVVSFKTNGTTIGTCNLQRADMVAAPTQQAFGQAPFASTCDFSFSFTATGADSTQTITVEYDGEPPAAGARAHNNSTYQFTLDFDPPPAPSGCGAGTGPACH